MSRAAKPNPMIALIAEQRADAMRWIAEYEAKIAGWRSSLAMLDKMEAQLGMPAAPAAEPTKRAAPGSVKSAVLAALQRFTAPASLDALEATGHSRGSIRSALVSLQKEKKVFEQTDGTWVLRVPAEQAAE